MTEESLCHKSLGELCDILVDTIEEYLKLEKSQDVRKLESKRAQLQIIHKVIADKKGNLEQRSQT